MKKVITSILIVIIALQFSMAQVTVAEAGSLPEAVSNNAVCAGFIGDSSYLYSFGGIDSTKIWSGIHLRSFRYNVQSGKAIQIPDLPDDMGKIAAGASRIDSIIYVFGGYHVFSNGSEVSSEKLHRYNVSTNTFLSNGADIPRPIDDHVQAVWRDSLIYIITGWSNNGNVGDVQIYDPSADEWQAGTSVPSTNSYRSFGASGTIINDTIYYFGGATDVGQFGPQNKLRIGAINPENPTLISWSLQTPDPDITAYRSASTQYDNKLYWIGGSDNTYNFNGIAYNGDGGVPPNKRILSSETGEVVWEQDFVEELPMDLRGIAEISPEIKYIAGGMIGEQKVTNKVFKLEFDDNTSVEIEDISIPLGIYPNPFIDELTLDHSEENKLHIDVFSLSGHFVLSMNVAKGRNTFSLKYLPPGSYFFKYTTRGKSYKQKILKVD